MDPANIKVLLLSLLFSSSVPWLLKDEKEIAKSLMKKQLIRNCIVVNHLNNSFGNVNIFKFFSSFFAAVNFKTVRELAAYLKNRAVSNQVTGRGQGEIWFRKDFHPYVRTAIVFRAVHQSGKLEIPCEVRPIQCAPLLIILG